MPEEKLITSRENERLIAVRKVRDGKDRTRCFIEGVRLASEAVQRIQTQVNRKIGPEKK